MKIKIKTAVINGDKKSYEFDNVIEIKLFQKYGVKKFSITYFDNELGTNKTAIFWQKNTTIQIMDLCND